MYTKSAPDSLTNYCALNLSTCFYNKSGKISIQSQLFESLRISCWLNHITNLIIFKRWALKWSYNQQMVITESKTLPHRHIQYWDKLFQVKIFFFMKHTFWKVLQHINWTNIIYTSFITMCGMLHDNRRASGLL